MSISQEKFEHILVALDGSKYANKALESAIALAKKFGSELLVLYVLQSPSSFTSASANTLAQIIESNKQEATRIVTEGAIVAQKPGR